MSNNIEIDVKSNINNKKNLLVIELLTIIDNIRTLQRKFIYNVKLLNKLHIKDCKLLRKKLKKNKVRNIKDTREPSGFAKPTTISKKLAKFMGVPKGTLLARTVVTKKVTQYIRENNLQVQENRRKFIPDNKLGSILSPLQNIADKNGVTDKEKGYTYFNLQKYISSQFPSKK